MKRTSRHSLFLLECILALLVFSLAAAACAQLFAKTYELEQEAESLNQSVLLAQSAAEAFRSCGGDAEQTALLLEAEPSEDGFSAWYGEDGSPASQQEAVYALRFSRSQAGGVAYGEITVSRDGSAVYALRAASALPAAGKVGTA